MPKKKDSFDILDEALSHIESEIDSVNEDISINEERINNLTSENETLFNRRIALCRAQKPLLFLLTGTEEIDDQIDFTEEVAGEMGVTAPPKRG